MKTYNCCWCNKSTDKGILDNIIGFGCCSKECKKNYMKTAKFKEIEGIK